jgi:Helix-turn-helix domain
MQKEYLTIPETAIKTGITQKSVRNRIWHGAFPHVRLGGRVLVPVLELEKFLAGLRGVSAEEALTKEAEDRR